MSLKAKIEAVIYASEEPVTLAQLQSLLGQEAQRTLDLERQRQTNLNLDPGLSAPEQGAVSPSVVANESEDQQAGGAAALESNATPEPPSSTEADTQERFRARTEREQAAGVRTLFRALLDELIADYGGGGRGLEIREVASGFRIATKPEYHDAVRSFVKSLRPPLKLSLQALETLAVVAYKQPITAPEISEVRGVDSGAVLGSLMARKLINTAGRKQVIGRPILYKTTRDFLVRFGLKDLSELPSIEEFEKLACELAEPEDLEKENSMSQPQPDGDATPLTPGTEGLPGSGAPTVAARLGGLPPASSVPGTDDDPTETPELASQIERDRTERTFPETAAKPSLEPR